MSHYIIIQALIIHLNFIKKMVIIGEEIEVVLIYIAICFRVKR